MVKNHKFSFKMLWVICCASSLIKVILKTNIKSLLRVNEDLFTYKASFD